MALLDNIVSWYNLESNGTDATGANTLSTNTNNSFGSSCGKIGNGVSVNSNDANHSVLALTSGASGLNIGTGNLSISLWMNRQGAGHANSWWPPIIFLEQDGNNLIGVSMHPTDGRIALFQVSGGANYHYAYFSAGITGTGWHHIVAIRDSATAGMKLWVDGTELSESSSLDGGTTTTLNIGKISISGDQADANDEFCGYVDLVGIWTKALSADEIATLYNSGGGYNPYSGSSTPTDYPQNNLAMLGVS
jgi:hypothetical protein